MDRLNMCDKSMLCSVVLAWCVDGCFPSCKDFNVLTVKNYYENFVVRDGYYLSISYKKYTNSSTICGTWFCFNNIMEQ